MNRIDQQAPAAHPAAEGAADANRPDGHRESGAGESPVSWLSPAMSLWLQSDAHEGVASGPAHDGPASRLAF